MSTYKSSGGKRLERYRQPNDPPPKDPFFGSGFDYIGGGETSNHRYRGHRHKEEDGGREKDRGPFAMTAKEHREHRESHAISSEAIAENYREQTRRAATQTPVPLSSDRGAPSGHCRGESDTGSYVRERPAPSKHGRGESDTGSYVRERPTPNRHGRGESDTGSYIRERPVPKDYGRSKKVVSFRERPASSRHSRSESDIGPYVGERPAPNEYGRGESDIVYNNRERPAPTQHSYGERVISFKERPAPSRYGRGESDIVYNIRERPAPNEYGRGESDIAFYVREGPAPREYGRGERVVSYSRERPAPSQHGRGESDIVTYIRERPAVEQPQRPGAHQMAGDRAPSLNLGPDSRLPPWRAPNPVRRMSAPPEANKLVGNLNSPPTPRRNPKPKKTPNQDSRGHVQPEQRLYKRVVDPPSLAGFSRWVSPPFSCKKSNDLPLPRGKYAMSGALGSPPPVKRRPRSPAKRERLASNNDIVRNTYPPRSKYEMSGALQPPPSVERRPRSPAKRERSASNGDIVHNKHRGNRHSGNSNSSNGSARSRGHTVQINQSLNVVLDGRRGDRGKSCRNVND